MPRDKVYGSIFTWVVWLIASFRATFCSWAKAASSRFSSSEGSGRLDSGSVRGLSSRRTERTSSVTCGRRERSKTGKEAPQRGAHAHVPFPCAGSIPGPPASSAAGPPVLLAWCSFFETAPPPAALLEAAKDKSRLQTCQQVGFTERQQKQARLNLEKNPVSNPAHELSKGKETGYFKLSGTRLMIRKV